MKKIILIIFFMFLLPTTGMCRDYVVDCITENYKEETQDFKHHLQIYHSMQINSIAGQKLLIIAGKNYRYRTWLREYIANSKKMIIKVPDDDNNNFISSKAYTIDVTSIYPVNEFKWNNKDTPANLKVITGERHILIVDSNIKRRKLLEEVVKDLGYPVTFLGDSQKALRVFQVQPENFYMVIANYNVNNVGEIRFIKKLSKISPQTPVIVGGSYSNKKINEKLVSDFSKMDNVIIRPVILKDLSKIINNILKNNV